MSTVYAYKLWWFRWRSIYRTICFPYRNSKYDNKTYTNEDVIDYDCQKNDDDDASEEDESDDNSLGDKDNNFNKDSNFTITELKVTSSLYSVPTPWDNNSFTFFTSPSLAAS